VTTTAFPSPDGRTLGYVVDGLNRRVGKKVNGVLAEGFLYDGQLRPVAWLDGTGAVKATFVYGLHVNVPEYMTTGAGTFRIVTDHLGSPRLVVNSGTGAVAQRMDYDSYGNVLSDTAPGFQPFGFAGGLYDRDTGLVRFGARDYEPATGRWTSKDPLGLEGGLNVYEYAGNDSVNNIDPSGRLWLNVGLGVIGGAMNLAGAYLANGDSLTLTQGLAAFGAGFANGFLLPFGGSSLAWAAGVGAFTNAGQYLASSYGSGCGGGPTARGLAGALGLGALAGGITGPVGKGMFNEASPWLNQAVARSLNQQAALSAAVGLENLANGLTTSWMTNLGP
jgi:RHS repeat-associated protein